MNWITRDLAIGNLGEAMQESFLASNHIDILVSLCSCEGVESLPIRDITSVTHIRIPVSIDLLLRDDVTTFKKKIKAASELIRYILEKNRSKRNSRKVLVHCHYGMDRAPATVALALSEMYIETETFRESLKSITESYEYVKSRRPETRMHWGWVTDQWNREDVEYVEYLKSYFKNLKLEQIRSRA